MNTAVWKGGGGLSGITDNRVGALLVAYFIMLGRLTIFVLGFLSEYRVSVMNYEIKHALNHSYLLIFLFRNNTNSFHSMISFFTILKLF